MSYNYFRNLKRQTQVDNRPKYLRYGDVFLSNKNNVNNNQQNKYNNSNPYDNIDYSKYNNTGNNPYDNIDYSKYNNKNSSPYDNTDYSKYNSKSSNPYNDTDHSKYSSKTNNVYDNVNYPRYSGRNAGSYAPNFSTTTFTREQVNDFDAANIDRVRTTNQINRNYNNSKKYNNEDDDLYGDIDYINYNNTNDYLKPSRSREQQTYDNDTSDAYNNYFFNSNSKVNYQKRQLPPLQQKYSSRNSQYDLQYDNKYWEDYDPYQSKHNKKKADTSLSFKFIWHKFIITFTSILSIVCIAWITYHWHSTANSESSKNNNAPELIEPDKPSFKVLPDTPGGIEIPYQDKSIYSRVDPTFNQEVQENLRVSQEVPADIPAIPIATNIDTKAVTIDNKSVTRINTPPIEEYSIVDERDYYVKCPIDGDKTVAIKQLNLLKKKLSTFPDSDMLENTTCSIRTVANTQGKRGKFILIGPFCDDNTAKQIGHFCKVKGEIISVKKNNRN